MKKIIEAGLNKVQELEMDTDFPRNIILSFLSSVLNAMKEEAEKSMDTNINIHNSIERLEKQIHYHIDSNRHELQSIHQTIGELSVKSKHPLFLYNEEKPIKSSFIPTSDPVKAEEWKPPHDEFYYYITSEMYVSKTRNSGFVADDQRIKDGNCFRTEQECEAALERVKVAIKGGN